MHFSGADIEIDARECLCSAEGLPYVLYDNRHLQTPRQLTWRRL